jgi:hypothetical protein
VQTSHPKAGSKLAGVVPPPTNKIKALLPKLSDLPAEAEAREKTVADLKSEIADLKRQVKAAPTHAVETKTVKVYTLKDGQLARAERLVGKAKAAFDAIGPALTEITAALQKASAPTPPPPKVYTPLSAPLRPVTPKPNGHADGLSNPEQRILDALAWLDEIGVPEPEQPAVSFLAGYSYGSGAFNNPRGSLRVKGYIDYLPGGRMRLTDAGEEMARYSGETLTSAKLHERVLSRLPNPEQRVLRPLLASYPAPMRGEDLAAEANYQFGSGAFNNPRGRLKTLGLIDYPQPGYVVARPLLFVD